MPAPIRVPSRGPNGTHWPSKIPTPYFDDTFGQVIDVGCSWSEIKAAIASLSPAAVDLGVKIRVAPGALTGNGSGSTSTAVMREVGSTTWTKRVLITPRDGYGTVTVGDSRLYKVYGVCFARFIFSSLAFQGCSCSALAHFFCEGFFTMNGAADATDTINVEICDYVLGSESRFDDQDRSNYWSLGTGKTDGALMDGGYAAPNYIAEGSAAHCDTIQFQRLPTTNPYTTNTLVRDCCYFGSSNSAFQTNNAQGLRFENSLVVAGALQQTRYPFPSGAATTNQAINAFNGGGIDLSAKDCHFIGKEAYSSQKWTSVDNCRVASSFASGFAPMSGSWIVDASLDSDTSILPIIPDAAYRAQIWGGVIVSSGVPPSVTSQPSSAQVIIGSSVTFTVTATGTAPLSYQWKKNGTNISGAISASYTISSVAAGDAASYSVTVSNSAGSVTSTSAALLTVDASAVTPTITSQPHDTSSAVGSRVTFTVTATGTAPLSYQWFCNGQPISGATSASYVIPSAAVSDSAIYSVNVGNSAGWVGSAGWQLTVSAPVSVNGALIVSPDGVFMKSGDYIVGYV